MKKNGRKIKREKKKLHKGQEIVDVLKMRIKIELLLLPFNAAHKELEVILDEFLKLDYTFYAALARKNILASQKMY